MAITLSERMQSRATINSIQPQIRFKYTASGTADDAALLTYLNANIPGSYLDLFLQSFTYEPINLDSISNTGLWEIEATYARPEAIPLDPDTASESFDTTGGTQHVVQSLATVASYVSSGSASDFKGAINVNKGKVEGVDITVPIYKWSQSYPFAASSITTGYKGLIFDLTGKVNGAAFKGFEAGEVLFLGATGQQRGTGIWVLDFQFASSPNLTNIEIGDITVAQKYGWNLIWVLYEAGTSNGRYVSVPIQANVEAVYETADFAALGIGT